MTMTSTIIFNVIYNIICLSLLVLLFFKMGLIHKETLVPQLITIVVCWTIGTILGRMITHGFGL